MNPPNITPGEWNNDDGMIRLSDQLDICRENIGTESEWQSVCIHDEDGPAEVVALCHPLNARAIAALPQCLRSLLGAYKALRTALPHVDPDSRDYGYAGEWLDEVKEALLAAGYTE